MRRPVRSYCSPAHPPDSLSRVDVEEPLFSMKLVRILVVTLEQIGVV